MALWHDEKEALQDIAFAASRVFPTSHPDHADAMEYLYDALLKYKRVLQQKELVNARR